MSTPHIKRVNSCGKTSRPEPVEEPNQPQREPGNTAEGEPGNDWVTPEAERPPKQSEGSVADPHRHTTGPIKASAAGNSELQEKVITSQTALALKLQSRIARRSERIARWNKESNEVEASWPGGLEYRGFCQRMAESAREKQQELEGELKRLQNRSDLAVARQHCLLEQGNL